MRFVTVYVPVTHPKFGKAIRCRCQESADRARRVSYLREIDGLSDAERQLGFETLRVGTWNQDAVDAVERATASRRGMVTLHGRPGVGKTRLLICAINAARDAGIPAVYTTVTDLLDYLRRAYNPERQDELTFDARWELLIGAEVLALDELDEFSATPWAMERFQRLIDERWRNMDKRVTFLATNARLENLPAKIASRLRDGRAEVVTLSGRDMRPLQEWTDSYPEEN